MPGLSLYGQREDHAAGREDALSIRPAKQAQKLGELDNFLDLLKDTFAKYSLLFLGSEFPRATRGSLAAFVLSPVYIVHVGTRHIPTGDLSSFV